MQEIYVYRQHKIITNIYTEILVSMLQAKKNAGNTQALKNDTKILFNYKIYYDHQKSKVMKQSEYT